jgi:DNA-binding MarR family transcriptional regulator
MIARLQATTHRLLEYLTAELVDLGLSQGEVNALAALETGAAVTVRQLQARTGQRASTLTGVLDRLERRGLIERTLNPQDRRSFTLRLTDAGVAAAARVQETFADLERRAPPAASRSTASSRCSTSSTRRPPNRPRAGLETIYRCSS